MTRHIFQVMPLSQRSGILEWCDNTTPLGEYLINAHIEHRPDDISPQDARRQMEAMQKSRMSTEDKIQVSHTCMLLVVGLAYCSIALT